MDKVQTHYTILVRKGPWKWAKIPKKRKLSKEDQGADNNDLMVIMTTKTTSLLKSFTT